METTITMTRKRKSSFIFIEYPNTNVSALYYRIIILCTLYRVDHVSIHVHCIQGSKVLQNKYSALNSYSSLMQWKSNSMVLLVRGTRISKINATNHTKVFIEFALWGHIYNYDEVIFQMNASIHQDDFSFSVYYSASRSILWLLTAAHQELTGSYSGNKSCEIWTVIVNVCLNDSTSMVRQTM